jgi:GNAT superfamily N-acetyltransferase
MNSNLEFLKLQVELCSSLEEKIMKISGSAFFKARDLGHKIQIAVYPHARGRWIGRGGYRVKLLAQLLGKPVEFADLVWVRPNEIYEGEPVERSFDGLSVSVAPWQVKRD